MPRMIIITGSDSPLADSFGGFVMEVKAEAWIVGGDGKPLEKVILFLPPRA